MKTGLANVKMRACCFAIVIFCGGSSLAGARLESVAGVDLTRYAGHWYEIAHQKNDYESDCVYSTADYVAMSPTELGMETTCYLEDGSHRILPGTGIVVNPAEPVSLRSPCRSIS